MKTKGTKAYKLFNKAVSVLTKEYNLYPKGINVENLHAVFTDQKHYLFAIKVVLNEQTTQIETYVAIANPVVHQSLDKFNDIKELREIIDNAIRIRTLSDKTNEIVKGAKHFTADVEE
jgi:hypothetical protein